MSEKECDLINQNNSAMIRIFNKRVIYKKFLMNDIDAINSHLEETSFLIHQSNYLIGCLMNFEKE